jgi:hypothetical protein
MWIEHEGVFFNLDLYKQICRGDDDEILLSAEAHNGTWDDEKNIASLRFESKEARNLAMITLEVKLSVEFI